VLLNGAGALAGPDLLTSSGDFVLFCSVARATSGARAGAFGGAIFGVACLLASTLPLVLMQTARKCLKGGGLVRVDWRDLE
jgi:hypothetical protein